MLLLVVTFYIEVRRPFLGVITILPVVLIVLWVFGVMSARGISFNPVTAMIANLAIGIGVPYTIHITHRYEEDRQRHDNPEEAELARREVFLHDRGHRLRAGGQRVGATVDARRVGSLASPPRRRRSRPSGIREGSRRLVSCIGLNRGCSARND